MQNEECPQATESDSIFQKGKFMERRQTNQFCYFHQGLYPGQAQVDELSLSVFPIRYSNTCQSRSLPEVSEKMFLEPNCIFLYGRKKEF